MINNLINDINLMLNDTKNIGLEYNDVVNEINLARYLGSGNQCYKVMYKVSQFFNVERILEIGTHKGASSIIYCQSILDNGKIPEIHTVDSWAQMEAKDIASKNIQKAGFSKYITMHTGDSLVKVPEVLGKIGDVDLIFIDGNHALDYVIKDYMNCKDHSKLILFHDTSSGNLPYLKLAENDGYEIYNFETKYLEGDGHLIGIALAVKK